MGGKSGGGEQTIGYRYFFDIHMGVSRGPVDELVEIKVGDKSAWPYPGAGKSGDGPRDGDEGDGVFNPEGEAYVVFRDPAIGVGRVFQAHGFPSLTVVLQGAFPIFWNAAYWVQIENFVRVDEFSTVVDKSGIYRVVGGGAGSSLSFRDDYLQNDSWDAFSRMAPVDPGTLLTVRYVQDEAGTPFPDDADPTIPPTPVDPITGSQVIEIQAGNLFGGDKAEGGIEGTLRVMMGEPDQIAPASLESMLGGPQPGFRRMFTLLYSGLISAMNPYPKVWKIRSRRALKGWDGPVFYPALAVIPLVGDVDASKVTSTASIKAMNPAHIIYECLTNREWGRGLNADSKLNLPSFTAAASILYSEGFGLCLMWARADTIESFVQSVLDHIGATLYEDPATALLTIKLIRGGYVAADLPLFDEASGLLEVTGNDIASAGGYVNEVKVTWHDPITNEDGIVKTQNLASIQASGGAFNSVTKTYKGLPTASLAYRVAQRDLRALGLELRKFTMTFDRRAHMVRPGDVIRVRSSPNRIRETLVRVARYEDGTLRDGKITLTLVQDVFGLPTISYTGSEPGTWTPPSSVRPCIGRHEVFEIPYVVLARQMRPADFAYVEDDAGYLGVVLEEGQPLNAGYKVAVRSGAAGPDDIPSSSASYCGYTP